MLPPKTPTEAVRDSANDLAVDGQRAHDDGHGGLKRHEEDLVAAGDEDDRAEDVEGDGDEREGEDQGETELVGERHAQRGEHGEG